MSLPYIYIFNKTMVSCRCSMIVPETNPLNPEIDVEVMTTPPALDEVSWVAGQDMMKAIGVGTIQGIQAIQVPYVLRASSLLDTEEEECNEHHQYWKKCLNRSIYPCHSLAWKPSSGRQRWKAQNEVCFIRHRRYPPRHRIWRWNGWIPWPGPRGAWASDLRPLAIATVEVLRWTVAMNDKWICKTAHPWGTRKIRPEIRVLAVQPWNVGGTRPEWSPPSPEINGHCISKRPRNHDTRGWGAPCHFGFVKCHRPRTTSGIEFMQYHDFPDGYSTCLRARSILDDFIL